MIVYRATVEGVSSVDVRLSVVPAADGETPIECREDDIEVNIPGAANAEDVGSVQRAFGALIGIKGAVRITIEPILLPTKCTRCGGAHEKWECSSES